MTIQKRDKSYKSNKNERTKRWNKKSNKKEKIAKEGFKDIDKIKNFLNEEIDEIYELD